MAAPRILFLIPYFGRWPFWMSFFLKSCRFNPDIQWLFFTDCGVPPDAPDNVRFRSLSFAEYCSVVSARLNIEFQPNSPYKLCDLKPALGYVHADELDGFDFWGFSDIDLIYGDLRSYFTDERIRRFDLLSTHERRVSGHFCLLRNSSRMREAFMQVPGWRSKLSASEHVGYDEIAFSRLFIRHKNWPAPLRRLFDICNPWRRHSEFVEAFSTPNGRLAWHDGSFNFPQRWIWQCGQLSNDRDGSRQYPYFHFIAWKYDAWPAHDEDELQCSATLPAQDTWSITSQGFREV
ncbi:DUF6625 family protein [Stutzerimonas kunmingensis]|uniref:DUF6625 family protein n=1 Tax=Stutzerimonas kunmingensis TaxID=1211807 RepID=UPI00241C9A66|nr:DUF6625 family protein [Stutzerimonas kunmingensis]